jgi:hypothetical protein
MSFDDVNADIRNGGGNYLALNKQGEGVVGVVLDVKRRGMVFNGDPVLNKNKEQRVEWVFTFDVNGETKKWAAKEQGQIAVREALRKAGVEKLEPNCRLNVKVTKSSVQGKAQAEYDITYEAPKLQGFSGSDEDTPF